MDKILQSFTADLPLLATRGIRIVLITLLAYLLTVIVNRFVRKLRRDITIVMERRQGRPDPELERRALTIGGIIRRTISVLIWVAAALAILSEVNIDIKPLLAGAGIVGLAVGFGAQNLVRDIFAGLFILIENQMRVNDVVSLNGTSGRVEEINLRTTVLRSLDGTVHIFPNGTIESMSNLTREFSYYVFKIGVAYKEDTDRVAAVLKQLGGELASEPAFQEKIIEPLEVLGVDEFADSAVVIKARFKTLPLEQWNVGREMNRRIKKRFDELGIEIPFPHMSLYFGEASKPVKIEAGDRQMLKEIVREVLEERAQTS